MNNTTFAVFYPDQAGKETILLTNDLVEILCVFSNLENQNALDCATIFEPKTAISVQDFLRGNYKTKQPGDYYLTFEDKNGVRKSKCYMFKEDVEEKIHFFKEMGLDESILIYHSSYSINHRTFKQHYVGSENKSSKPQKLRATINLGHGIEVSVPVLAAPNENAISLRHKAIHHLKKYLPNQFQINTIEEDTDFNNIIFSEAK